jgi:hypothetical protein
MRPKKMSHMHAVCSSFTVRECLASWLWWLYTWLLDDIDVLLENIVYTYKVSPSFSRVSTNLASCGYRWKYICSPGLGLVAIPVHFFWNIGVKQIRFVFVYTTTSQCQSGVQFVSSYRSTERRWRRRPCRRHSWSRMASRGDSVGAGRSTHNTRHWPRHPCLRSYRSKTGSWWWCDHGGTRGNGGPRVQGS